MDENNTVDTEALKERIKEIVEKGNVSRIQIRKNETVIMNIPVNAGILGGVLGVMAAPWAMIAGTVATLGLNCSVEFIREDGSVYALYSFARKLGQALAAGLSGWLLEGIGYNSAAAAEGLAQTESVLEGIFNISTLVPALGFALLGLILWFWYPLHKKQVDANVAALKEKHGR